MEVILSRNGLAKKYYGELKETTDTEYWSEMYDWFVQHLIDTGVAIKGVYHELKKISASMNYDKGLDKVYGWPYCRHHIEEKTMNNSDLKTFLGEYKYKNNELAMIVPAREHLVLHYMISLMFNNNKNWDLFYFYRQTSMENKYDEILEHIDKEVKEYCEQNDIEYVENWTSIIAVRNNIVLKDKNNSEPPAEIIRKPTLNQFKTLIDEELSMIDLLYKANPDGNYQAGSPCFCPFHDNTHTPSAAIYDNEGIESLYCFSERKTYRPSDVIEKLLDKNVYLIAEKYWNRLSREKKLEFLARTEEESLEDSFSEETHKKDTKEIESANNAFKYGKIKAHDLLKKYSD